MLHLHSIFRSWDGEVNAFDGIGQASVFIRTAGCPLRCSWCDTPDALNVQAAKYSLPWTGVFDSTMKFGIGKITLTGGEPLAQDADDLNNLIAAYEKNKCGLTIETGGSMQISRLQRDPTFTRFVIDYKLPSSGMEDKMITQLFPVRFGFSARDKIKMVIRDWVDFKRAVKIVRMNAALKVPATQFCFSPMLDSESWSRLVGWLERPENADVSAVNLNVQMHKILKMP